MKKKFWIGKIIGCIVMGSLVAALLAYVVMELWNHVLVGIVQVPVIGFWQALGLLVLSKILFGGLGGGCGGRGCGNGRRGFWKNELREKWRGMSPEEREKIKEAWRERCKSW